MTPDSFDGTVYTHFSQTHPDIQNCPTLPTQPLTETFIGLIFNSVGCFILMLNFQDHTT